MLWVWMAQPILGELPQCAMHSLLHEQHTLGNMYVHLLKPTLPIVRRNTVRAIILKNTSVQRICIFKRNNFLNIINNLRKSSCITPKWWLELYGYTVVFDAFSRPISSRIWCAIANSSAEYQMSNGYSIDPPSVGLTISFISFANSPISRRSSFEPDNNSFACG